MSNKELPLLMPEREREREREREHLFWQLTYHLKEKKKRICTSA